MEIEIVGVSRTDTIKRKIQFSQGLHMTSLQFKYSLQFSFQILSIHSLPLHLRVVRVNPCLIFMKILL